MNKTLEETEAIELDLEHSDGTRYKGRFTGREIDSDADGGGTRYIYLADDERVIFYDADKLEYWVVQDPEQELEGWPGALNALGITPVVDI